MLPAAIAPAVHPGRLKTRRGPLERLSRSRVFNHATTSLPSSQSFTQFAGLGCLSHHCGACNVLRRLPRSTNARLKPKFQERLDNRCNSPSSSSHSPIQRNTPISASSASVHRPAFNPPHTIAIMDAPEPETPFAAVSAQTTKFQRVSSVLKELR